MLATKFMPRTEFASYEDFKENYSLNYPENFNFATHVVDAYASCEPHRRAIAWCDDNGNSAELDFAGVSERSQRFAALFKAQGINKGDRVMLILKRRLEYWLCAVALHRIGAVIVPASYQLTAKDIAYRLDESESVALICAGDDYVLSQSLMAADSAKRRPLLFAQGGAREGFLDLDALYAAETQRYIIDPTMRVTDLMIMYFTSGTTGFPKMVLHDNSYPLGHITTAMYWQGCRDGGLHLTVTDSGWAKFGWGCMYGQWLSGSAVLGYDMNHRFDPAALIDVIRRYAPTTLCVPGTMYRFMLREGLKKEDFASIKHCCTAGEPLNPDVVENIRSRTGLTVHEGFGQSETTVLCANFGYFEARAGSMGKPSPLYDIHILARDGHECPPGETGELTICSLDKRLPEGLVRCYRTGGEFVSPYDEQHRYHTGDLCWCDEDGYFHFVGRDDDMIKCSAYRIGPFEIESVLLTHPAVKECAVTGAPDELRGQVVKASIVLAPGFSGTPELTRELQEHVKHGTAPYKYPRVVEYVHDLPKTTSGKVMRASIRKAAQERACVGA